MTALSLLQERVQRVKAPRVMYETTWNGGLVPETESHWRRHPQKLFRKKLSSYAQITVNTAIFKNSIGFDVDNPEGFTPPTEYSPSWRAYNQTDDRHHIHYLLEKPFYLHSEELREQYRDRVHIPLQKIAFIIGADARYKNTTTKNPFNNNLYRVSDDGGIIRSVYDFINLFSSELSETGEIEKYIKADNQYISPKYREQVAKLIEHSMLNNRLIFSDVDQFTANMRLFGEIEEIDTAITEDAITKATTLAGKFSELQTRRINKRWKLNTERIKQRIREAFFRLTARGERITYQAISSESGIPVQTIKNNEQYRTIIKGLRQ